MTPYDVAIIGSGIGGLLLANILAKEGKKVLLIEKNPSVGGLVKGFSYKGYHLDTGLHYVGQLHRGALLGRLFSYLGIYDQLSLEQLDHQFDRLLTPFGAFSYSQDRAETTQSLIERFPHAKQGIEHFMEQLTLLSSSTDVRKISERVEQGLQTFQVPVEHLQISDWEMIQKAATGDPALTQILSAHGFLFAGWQESNPFYPHVQILNSFFNGAYRFQEGGSELVTLLEKQLKAHGGEVLCGRAVQAIHCKERRVVALELSDGVQVQAGQVVSTLYPATTYRLLKGEHGLRQSLRTRLESYADSGGFLILYLLKERDKVLYNNENVYLFAAEPEAVWRRWAGKTTEVETAYVTTRRSSAQSPYVDVVEIMTPMSYSEVANFAERHSKGIQTAYEEWRQRETEALLTFVQSYLPDIDDCTVEHFTLTPLSFRDYVGAPYGAAYGMRKDYRMPTATILSPKSRVDGLYLAGQSVNFHGILGTSISSILAAYQLLGEAYLAPTIFRE